MDQLTERCERVAADRLEAAARAICQARCALGDRDYNCQEMGRCGLNWRVFEHHVLKLMRGPVT
jgi:hypothetical protein